LNSDNNVSYLKYSFCRLVDFATRNGRIICYPLSLEFISVESKPCTEWRSLTHSLRLSTSHLLAWAWISDVRFLEYCDDADGCCVSRIIVYQPVMIIRLSLRNFILWRKTEFSAGNYEPGPIM